MIVCYVLGARDIDAVDVVLVKLMITWCHIVFKQYEKYIQ